MRKKLRDYHIFLLLVFAERPCAKSVLNRFRLKSKTQHSGISSLPQKDFDFLEIPGRASLSASEDAHSQCFIR